MNIPKAVIFDLGKVLLDFDYDIVVRRIQQHSRLSFLELKALINQSPLLHRYESNAISTALFFAEIQSAAGFSRTFAEFKSMFSDMFTAIEPMVRLQQSLRREGVPTYIFSNTNELAIEHVRATFPFFNSFDGYILSYEHNAMKPEASLYQVVERVAKRQGPDLLYIDDRPENIETGKQRAWQVILHADPIQTEAAVRKTGLLGRK